ncbi:MAG: hypothetical protein FJX47_20035, partial [Alphaproteobacteria bacterium]|nr:hypothetical protein [Alphaproteobacteria bacterium]
MIEPFAKIPDRHGDIDTRKKIEAAVGRRRRSTREANLGTFTGYRIGLDLGSGNIGWCILFEDGDVLRFLSAEAIAAHNAALGRGQTKTQLPRLEDFVPLGTYKFEARDNDGKAFAKGRAEAKARRRHLDGRCRRRKRLRDVLEEIGLYPRAGESFQGRAKIPADKLRLHLLDTGTATHRHDLGRALYNALKRRGQMKPVGRAGMRKDSTFGAKATEAYRAALSRFECRTVGEFLEKCQAAALADGRGRIRKRHKPLSWQEDHKKEKPKDDADSKIHEVFPFLTPTFELMWEEASKIRAAQATAFPIAEADWQGIEEAAGARGALKPKKPGRCQYLPEEFRCVRALPSFQEFRVLEQVANLRLPDGGELPQAIFERAVEALRGVESIGVDRLGREIGAPGLGLAEKEASRKLAGAKTDVKLAEILGGAWLALDLDHRDRWTMRFLRRHEVIDDKNLTTWSEADDEALAADAARTFGPEALERVDEYAGKIF